MFAAHTHTQPAQPSTIAHYLLAVIEQLERDTVRLRAAYASTNLNPLGSCAITGTGFPIDRNRTTELLGFDGATGNTYGSIATVDYLIESVSAAMVLLTGLGRVLQDLLLWCTSEFGYLRLADGFVQGSSIMPQKRNPVALEHARAIASKALGQASGIVLSVHNTPFGDIVDTEDDLQPLVASMFNDANRAVRLVAAAMAGAVQPCAGSPNAPSRVGSPSPSSPTRWCGITMCRSRPVTESPSKFVAECERRPSDPRSAVLREVAVAVIGRAIEYDEPALATLLSARHFVAVRTTPGGPAPSETRRAIAASRRLLASDGDWCDPGASAPRRC